MNLSNPKTIKAVAPAKVNPIKAMAEKAWAGLSMVSLMVPGANTKANLPAKNIGVLIFIILVSYFGICGLWMNINWLLNIKISGEWFYYTGISVLVFTAIEFFNLEKKVREFAVEKKLSYPNKDSLLEKITGRSKLYNIVALLMEAISFFWVILGIIFYDRSLFIALFILYIFLSGVAQIGCKKTEPARNVFMIESIFSIALLAFIIISHFFNY